MAGQLTKRNSRVANLGFSYDTKGELQSVVAQVAYDIYDDETKMVVTSPVKTVPVELTDGTRKALSTIVKRLVE